MRYLITGTAGFIGFHLAKRLLDDGHFVVGFDGMTQYYDTALKEKRHAILARSNGFKPVIGMLEDKQALDKAAALAEPDVIVHLAAQAGVRYSLENPRSYVDSNLVGSFNILEIARELKPQHLLLASTSSVYGANEKIPFSESDKADEPMTIYAATKKSMELMAHSYAHLFKIPTTAFRFFTVYGPWGRPDMALFKFVDAIRNDRPIDIYGEGKMSRDFTYIDDLVEGIVRLMAVPPAEENRVEAEGVIDTLSRHAPYRTVNIGGGQPVELMRFVETIESILDKPAKRNMLPMQQGDVLHLCRTRSSGGSHGLPSGHRHRSRRAALRRMVSGRLRKIGLVAQCGTGAAAAGAAESSRTPPSFIGAGENPVAVQHDLA